MNQSMLAGMLEATRLTQSGRLEEATATIQRALRGMYSPAAANEPQAASEEAPLEGSYRVVGSSPARPQNGPEAQSVPPAQKPPFGFHGRPQWRGFDLPRSRPRPEAPADVVPEGGRFITGSYSNHAGTRGYKLYIPSRHGDKALPLVVMLHGCTQDPDDFAAGTRMNRLAEDTGCLVLYPAQSPNANMQKCWNWFNAGDQQRNQGEPSLIAGMTLEIAKEYRVDRRRIYVAGLSSGGAMAAILGKTYPELYAAVGVHSGLAHGAARDLPSAFTAMRQGGAAPHGTLRTGHSVRPVASIVFHGDRDVTVHPRNGEQVIAQCIASGNADAQAAGQKPRVTTQQGQVPGGHAYTRAVYHGCDGDAISEQWTIHGAGHAWSGGSPSGSYTDPKGPDAAREMLRFFLSHTQEAASGAAH